MKLPSLSPTIAAIWRAALSAASLKTWAITLGAPALCAIVVWGITILETAVYAQEPVRLEVVGHIADILKILTLLIGVIVVALAAVSAKVTTAAGSFEIDGDDEAGDDAQPHSGDEPVK